MKTKEKSFSKLKRMVPFWLSFIVIFAVSCHEGEFWDPEIKKPPSLEYLEIEPGTFVGEYVGGKWQISLPPAEVWNALPQRFLMFYAHGIVDPVPYE